MLLVVEKTDAKLNMMLRYHTSILSEYQASNLAGTMTRAISCFLEDPSQRVRDVSLFSHQNLHDVAQWNRRGATTVYTESIIDIIAAKCRSQARGQAICAWDGVVSYGDLDKLSSKLATHLRGLGVDAKAMVPVCFDKSLWAVVAMVAVSKAGAAFVPMDATHPVRRLKQIISQVNAKLVLASDRPARLLVDTAEHVITVSKSMIMQLPGTGLPQYVAPQPHDAAYVLFTSGSTGKPKGCVVEHRALAAVADHAEAFRIKEDSRVMQFASYSFTVCIIEIFCTLAAGGTVCIPSEHDRLNDLSGSMNQMEVTWALLARSVVNSLGSKLVPGLETLVVAGEPLGKDLIKLWAQRVHLVQAYGVTESAGVCTVQPNITAVGDPRNIGMSPHAKVWVVNPDNYHVLAPVGAVGELLIESPCLAREYLHNAEKTAAAFIYDPVWLQLLGKKKGTRLYKTGDLVQYMADGSLCFMGRKDTQVKLRGQRIELGEVEHHVQRCFTGARDVVAEVVTPVDTGRPPVLVAFVWADCDGVETDDILAAPTDVMRAGISAAEIALREAVPSYMVPAVFLPIVAVPLTATGKTDRRRLRDRAAALSQQELEAYSRPTVEKRMPTTVAEHALQQLWARVLNILPETIGADDSFFRLGGDSIVAMQLAGAAREDGYVLAVTDVFLQPRLSDQAAILQTAPDKHPVAVTPFSLLGGMETRDAVLHLAVTQCQVRQDQISDIYPCTALQEGLIALSAKTAGAYTGRVSFQLPRDVDLVQVQSAWNAVASANPILNTRIIQHDTWGSFQAVVPGDLPWSVHENEDAPNTEPLPSFGLGDPLVRATVVKGQASLKTGPRLILTMHHAVYDAWSLPLLLEQAEAALRGQALIPRPFSSFIAYLSRSKPAAEAFWQSELADLNATCFPPLPAPAYIPTPTESLTHLIKLPQGPAGDFTLSTKLLLAWAVTVAQYSSTDDVVFGLTVTGRGIPVAGIERMTGPTIATIPLRLQLEPDATVEQALQTTQDQTTRVIPYEQTGLQNIRRLGPDGEAACQFQNHLVIQPHREDHSSEIFADQEISSNQGAFTTYALTLVCNLSPDSVTVQAAYDPHVIGSIAVQRMLYQLAHVMGRISQHADTPVRDIGGLSPEDHGQLQQWNATVPQRVDRCMHELIAERCRAQPDAPAVCAWDGDFTYGELDRSSSALAAHLAGLGVGPGGFVPLLFEKSRWTPVALLGVMKAGGAFVLLDPSHPRARLEGICRQVSARLILASVAQSPSAEQLAEQVVTVGSDESMWRSSSNAFGGSAVVPDSALYAVFTSGSTGVPKGIVIPHSAYCTSALSQSQALGLSEYSRVFQFSSYAFDVSILEHLATLLAKACICIPSDADRYSNIGVAASKLRVTWAELTPSTAKMLHSSDLAALETLVLIGEPVTSSDISRYIGQVDLKNGYGPAECAAITTVQPRIEQTSDEGNIGRGTGCVCWIVDPHNAARLLPIGAVGELLIEGPIVGRGYLNEREKTTAAFIDWPAWLREFRATYPGNPGGDRLYKTGDLAQYAADGSLRFVGRKDLQVKLRGQRIELGEVEHHVRQCFAGARDVVAEVVTPTEAGRAAMLVAFVLVGDEGPAESKEDILTAPTDAFRAAISAAEAELHDAVPAYMVPAVFLPLAVVPLTATGKTDRRRLRERAAVLSRAEIEASTVPVAAKRQPTTAAERTLQGLWAQALNLPPNAIGADDSFFHLGGDSLAAMRVATLSHSAGLNISVGEIFKHRRLSLICSMLSPLASSASPQLSRPLSLVDQDISFTDLSLSSHPVIDPSNIVDVIPATEAQIWFLTQWSSPFFSFLLRGQMVMSRLQYVVKQLVKKHASLRTVFCEHRGNILQVVLEEGLSCFEHIHTDGSLESVFRDVSDRETRHPSLSIQPFKVMLVSRSDEEHLLIIRLSHAQYDGYSLSPLLQDLASAYNNYLLPVSITVSFSDYVYFCRQQPSKHANQFWSELLHGSRVTRVPLPSVNESDDIVSIRESASTSLAPLPQDTTYPILVNACVAFVLSKLVDSGDIVFGLVVNTRSLPMQHIDSVVGPCINVLPFRLILQPDQSASNLCMKVRELYADISQYCHLELPDIAGTTNDWWTVRGALPFGCVVNHISADESSDPLSLEGLSCSSFSKAARINLPNQVLIRSIVQEEKLCIEILTSTDKRARDCSSKFASCLATAVLSTVEQVSEKFSSPLSSMNINLDGLSIRPA